VAALAEGSRVVAVRSGFHSHRCLLPPIRRTSEPRRRDQLYYTKLERGDTACVSETVLESLARALQLDQAGRYSADGVRRADGREPPVGASCRYGAPVGVPAVYAWVSRLRGG
jgi:hypothetical protein